MVVLQIQAVDVSVLFGKRNPPIAGDGNAPVILPVPGEPVHMPARRGAGNEPIDVFGKNEYRQDFAHPVDEVLPQEPGVVILRAGSAIPGDGPSERSCHKCTV